MPSVARPSRQVTRPIWRNESGESCRIKKARAQRPGLILVSGLVVRSTHAGLPTALEDLLDGLVGVLGHGRVHAANLGHLLHIVLVGLLGEAGLDFEGLL